ncbi:HAD family phosphatase [Candidatus Saccharibacteria bacterium]|nr:MAG: HAD family phosphatase [Candidatus Saccharibacteria bacterium]
MIKAILFDCFGVVLTDALQQIRADLERVDPEGAKEVAGLVAANNRGLLHPAESNERIAHILGLSTEEFRGRVAEGEVRNEQLLSYILKLRKTYLTAMLSNIAGSSLRRRFPDNELNIYFDKIVASGDIGYAKPEPEAYEFAIQALGVLPSECVFIDDRDHFCSAAQAHGMKAIVYTDFAQFKHELEHILANTKD